MAWSSGIALQGIEKGSVFKFSQLMAKTGGACSREINTVMHDVHVSLVFLNDTKHEL